MTMMPMSGDFEPAIADARSQLFAIHWNPVLRVFTVAFTGFWQAGHAQTFAVAMTEAVARAGGRPFDAICDVSQTQVQTQKVIALQAQLAAALVAAGMQRLVMVGAGPLLMMQARRATAPLVPGFVDTQDAAHAWLAAA